MPSELPHPDGEEKHEHRISFVLCRNGIIYHVCQCGAIRRTRQGVWKEK